MIQTLLLKNIIPFMIGMITATSAVLGIIHYTNKKIEISCPPPQVKLTCPKCPEQPNTIDIDKLKNFKGKFEVHQHYRIEANGDSMILKLYIKELQKELNNLRVVKCR